MSSYAFLLVYSGFKFDMTKNMIGFKPLKNGRYFWSVDGAWGTVLITQNTMELNLLYGQIKLSQLVTPFEKVEKVMINGQYLEFAFEDTTVFLNANLNKNDIICIN